MINTLKRATKLAPLLAVAAIFATAAPAFAQAPSQAQRDAIKSQCRSDYMAHCSSVPPGGEASLQCLQKNMSSLSSSCQSAVRAVEAPAAATRQAGRHRGAESRSAGGCNDRSAEIRRAKGCSRRRRGTADQRADFRHPQRLPLRLSKGLRGRADRRRAGAAMPGKEQGETLGRLREGRRRRQRRWRGSARGRRGSGRSGSGGRRCTGGADRDRAAADAAARRTVRAALGLRRRRPLDLRRRGSLAAAASCSAWRPMPPSFRRPARTCCPSSRRDNRAPAAILH